MKKSLFAAAVVALALVSCNKKAEEVKDAVDSTAQETVATVDSTAGAALDSTAAKAEEVKDAAAAKVEEGAAKVEATAKEVKEEVKK
jgi:hypothetical protein